MKLFKLVYEGNTIGYRLSNLPQSNISLDMTPELAKEVLGYIDKSNVVKGTIIEMKFKDNLYVSDNEQNVVEANNLKECMSYINSVKSSEGMLDETFNNESEEKKILRKEIDEEFLKEGNRYDFSEYEGYEEYKEIGSFVRKLKSASKNCKCKVLGFIYIEKWDSKLKADIHVPNLFEAAKYIHNFYKNKNSLDIICIKGNKTINNTVESIFDYMKEKSGLSDGYYYPGISEDKSIDSIEDFNIEIYLDIVLTVCAECSVPGYNM